MLGRLASLRARLCQPGHGPKLLAAAAASSAAVAASAAAACAVAPESNKPAASAAEQLPPSAPASSSWSSPFQTIQDAVYDNVIAPYAEPSRDKLLPDLPPNLKGREKPTLVISLDGTLIESQWTRQFGWRYIKRPGVDDFLMQLAQLYELVLWTDCQNTAEPVIDRLDPRHVFKHRLYRDTTTYTQGEHKKDLSVLNRDLNKTLIIDCRASAFSMQPQHGIAIRPYESESDPLKEDATLKNLVPWLQFVALNYKVNRSSAPFCDELQTLGVSTNIEDGGVAFKTATDARFAELRAAGKMPLQRSRGSIFGGGSSGGTGAGGGTVWEKMGLRKTSQ